MSEQIIAGAVAIAPDILLGYQSRRATRTNVHDIIGRASADVTLRPAGLRSGTLRLGFAGAGAEARSRAAENALSEPVTCTLNVTTNATAAMTFVVVGDIERELEDETRNAWIVAFGYQEATA